MSALSDLFQEIADAIRTKTGGTAAMTPASFPDNILGIEVGGSSGDGSGSSVVFAQGDVPSGNATYTATHGLGVTPDFMLVFYSGLGATPSSAVMLMACGFSQAFMDAHGLTYGYYMVYNKSSGALVGMGHTVALDAESTASSAFLTQANAATVKIGNTTYPMDTSKAYHWIALGNLV